MSSTGVSSVQQFPIERWLGLLIVSSPQDGYIFLPPLVLLPLSVLRTIMKGRHCSEENASLAHLRSTPVAAVVFV